MEDKITFGKWEGTSIILVSLCTKIFLNFPRMVAEQAGTAGWIFAFYLCALLIAAFIFISKLYSKFPGKDIIDITEEFAGKIGKMVLGIILVVYFLFVLMVVLRQFSENVKIISLANSPISFVTFFFVAGMILGAFMGIEAIVRVSAIVIPFIIIGYLLISAGVSQYNDFSRIMPVLGNGAGVILAKGLPRISVHSEIIIMFLIPPFVKTHEKFKKIAFWGIGLSTVFLTLSTLTYLLVYQYPTAIENFLPMYQLARLINYGRFFQRIEAFFLIIWGITAFLYLSVGLYLLLHVFKKAFNLKYYKPLIIPFAIIIYTISLVPPNLITVLEMETEYFRTLSWTVTFGLTTFILLFANIRLKLKNKRRQRN